jgi:hypothetical protein
LRPILAKVVSMVLGLILIASRVFWGRMVFSDDGWPAGADGSNADRHSTSYVVWFHGKERDKGNRIMA